MFLVFAASTSVFCHSRILQRDKQHKRIKTTVFVINMLTFVFHLKAILIEILKKDEVHV